MQPSLPETPGSVLATRAVSALALVPPVLLAVWMGPPLSDLLLLLAGGVMAWEWGSLVRGPRPFGQPEALLLGASLLAVLAGALAGPETGAWVVAVGALAAMLPARRGAPKAGRGEAAEDSREKAPPAAGNPLWYGFGVLYVAVPLLAFQWLRGDDRLGADLVFWLLAVVWATDIGAYAAGRHFKGPKMLPRVSPSKTWSGLSGGMLAAALVGALAAAGLALPRPGGMAVLAVGLAVVSQAGDFLESGVKRRFGRKDASGLIPGHGGLLDRVDGLIAATLLLAFLVWTGEVPL